MPELPPASSCIMHLDANHVACIGIPNAGAILALFASLQHRCGQHIAGTSRKEQTVPIFAQGRHTMGMECLCNCTHIRYLNFGRVLDSFCVGLVASTPSHGAVTAKMRHLDAPKAALSCISHRDARTHAGIVLHWHLDSSPLPSTHS